MRMLPVINKLLASTSCYDNTKINHEIILLVVLVNNLINISTYGN